MYHHIIHIYSSFGRTFEHSSNRGAYLHYLTTYGAASLTGRMGAAPCQRCCDATDAGNFLGDEPVVPIFSDEIEALSLPPIIPSKSLREMSPQNSKNTTPKSMTSRTPKTPKTPKTPHLTEHADLDSEISEKGQENPVVMEEEFDFYDPLSKKAEVCLVMEEVRHHRPGANGPPTPRAPPEKLSALTPKTAARNQVEIITKWGVISGKLIFSRVLTLTTMSSMYVIRAQQARFEQNSRVWRRIEGRARRVVTAAASLTAYVVEETEDMYHSDWRTEGGALAELFTSEYIDTLMILAKAGAKLLASQPVLAEAKVPCRIFGDIHGQLRDLLLLFAAFGFPGSKEDTADCETR